MSFPCSNPQPAVSGQGFRDLILSPWSCRWRKPCTRISFSVKCYACYAVCQSCHPAALQVAKQQGEFLANLLNKNEIAAGCQLPPKTQPFKCELHAMHVQFLG